MTSANVSRGGALLLLNGPAGVGKTTLGRLLASQVRSGVCIHGDDLKRFVVRREDGLVPSGMAYAGGALLADLYLRAGYELVIFEFVFENRRSIERFLEAFPQAHEFDVHLITLWAPLETVLKRESERPNRARLGSRVMECWRSMKLNLRDLGTIVDATPETADVLRTVQDHLSSSQLSESRAKPTSMHTGR